MTSAGVKIADVLDAARRGRALLAPESAGYLVLAAADQLARSPVWLDEHLCGLLIEGGRVVLAPSAPTSALEAERALRDLLRRLLEAANGRAPALNAVAQSAPKGNVAGLVAELESALIPVNRSAAGRALSRLARDAVRARETGGAREAVAPSPARSEPEVEIETEAAGDDTEPIEIRPPKEDSIVEVTDDDLLEAPDDAAKSATGDRPSVPQPSGSTSDLDDLLAARLSSVPPPVAVAAAPPAYTAPPPAYAQPLQTAPVPSPALPPLPVPSPLTPLPVPSPLPPPRTPAPALASPLPPPVAPAPSAVAAAPSPALPPVSPLAAASPSTSSFDAPWKSPTEDAPWKSPTGDSDGPQRPSHPSGTMRGVDELLQDFMSTTSRKDARVSKDLRKMAGVEVTPPPPTPAPTPTPGTTGARAYESPFHNAAGAADFYTATPPPRAMTAQSAAPPAPDEDPLAPKATRRNVYLILALLALLTLGTVTLFRLEPGFLSGRTADVIEAEKREAAAAAASIAARAAAGVCRATLVVADVPPGAEVLVRSGVAPLDVERVPSRTRLEFVALVDGYAPRRGVIPNGVEWETGGGKPRFELPIQLEKSRSKSGVVDPWPPAEAGSVVGGQGPPGTVHVVTSPRGAEVWMVAGGPPEAKLESLPCRAGLELLVAGTTQGQPFRRRLKVDASQLTPEASANVVTGRVSAK